VQATIKITYGCTIEGPVTIKLIAQGSVYLYDIKIVAGAVSTIIRNRSIKSDATLWTKDNMIINSDRVNVAIFTLAGKKVMVSDMQQIPLTEISKGIYLVRFPTINGWKSFHLFR
jgi:hypothetical protein